MATKRCSFCRAETQQDRVIVTLCKSCNQVANVGCYISGFWVLSWIPLSYFQPLTPGSTVANIWVTGMLLPIFVLVPIYLLVARLRNFTTGWSSKQEELQLHPELSMGLFMGCYLLFFLWPLLSAAAVFLYQCYLWLRTGEWFAMPIIFLFEKIVHPDSALAGSALGRWFASPESWLGLHKLISSVPLTVALLLLGAAIIALPLAAGLEDHMAAKRREKARRQEKT